MSTAQGGITSELASYFLMESRLGLVTAFHPVPEGQDGTPRGDVEPCIALA